MFGPIVIRTDQDLTPPGPRSIRIVTLKRSKALRFYVSGRIFRTLDLTPGNLAMGREWQRAGQ